MGVLAMVGVTERSMRSMIPASSMLKNISSGDAAPAAISRVSAAMPMKTAGFGWTTARLSIHGSRGRTQQMASGSTPRWSSQMQASVAVLPEPAITYCDGPSSISDQLVDGHHARPSVVPNGAGERVGIRGE